MKLGRVVNLASSVPPRTSVWEHAVHRDEAQLVIQDRIHVSVSNQCPRDASSGIIEMCVYNVSYEAPIKSSFQGETGSQVVTLEARWNGKPN